MEIKLSILSLILKKIINMNFKALLFLLFILTTTSSYGQRDTTLVRARLSLSKMEIYIQGKLILDTSIFTDTLPENSWYDYYLHFDFFTRNDSIIIKSPEEFSDAPYMIEKNLKVFAPDIRLDKRFKISIKTNEGKRFSAKVHPKNGTSIALSGSSRWWLVQSKDSIFDVFRPLHSIVWNCDGTKLVREIPP